ncbi:MAG: hypothetical protein JO294_09130, partial [Alphaproteobacteria bacterium]|nr:hypothetical protein [Alphaproteobacteria bacterium]
SEIADILDKTANDIELRAKVFEAIDAQTPNHVEKAMTILRLRTGGMLTEGRLSGRARALVVGYLSKPGFLSGYIAQTAAAADGSKQKPDAVMAELMDTLGKAGITAETGLKSIAA